MKITQQFLEDQIAAMPKYIFPTKRTTICIITTLDGSEFIGVTTCASEDSVDPEEGKSRSYAAAFKQMWMPYNFALRQRVYEAGL